MWKQKEQLKLLGKNIDHFRLLQQATLRRKTGLECRSLAPFAMSVNRYQSHLLGKPLDADQKGVLVTPQYLAHSFIVRSFARG